MKMIRLKKSISGSLRKRIDNRGAAIAMTIVAIAIISVLAVLALWIAYMNYYMKVTDMRSTENFYSAEGVLEQIRIGLQNELSDATGNAYRNVLQRYGNTGYDTETLRRAKFKSEVMKELREALKVSSVAVTDPSPQKYDLKKLCEYVPDKNYAIDALHATTHLGAAEATSYTLTLHVDGTGVARGGTPEGDNTVIIRTNSGGWMDWDDTEGEIYLRDVEIEYQDSLGYVSVINTDFKLKAPTVKFGVIGQIKPPRILEFAVLADQHLDSDHGAGGNVSFKGNVYAGNGELTLTSNPAGTSDTPDRHTMGVDSAQTWNFSDAEYVISGEAVTAHLNTSLNIPESATLYTRDIVLGGETRTDNGVNLTLGGKTYVRDDLSIDGRDCNVSLSGEYYGYGIGGNDTDDEDNGSSAILINGQGTTLDLAGTTKLWVGGHSYVGTRKRSVAGRTKNANVPMGDSIAIRGNQIAYLIPSEAIATPSRNPLSSAEYEEYIEPSLGDPGFSEVNMSTEIPSLGVPINTYTSRYQKVFSPGLAGTYLVYYYMVMDVATANRFFEDYYAVEDNKAAIDNYLFKYITDDIKVPVTEGGLTRLDMGGNWLTLDTSVTPNAGKLIKTTDIDPGKTSTTEVLEADSIANQTKFRKMVLNPDPDHVGVCASDTVGNLYTRAFYNVIDVDKVIAFCGAVGTRTFTSDEGYKGIVTTDNYDYTGADTSIRLIISMKDVTINGNFKGLVLAAGTVKVKDGATISIDDSPFRADTVGVLKTKEGTRAYKDFFRNMRIDEDPETDDTAVTETNFNKLVNYENWTKK